MEEEKRTKRLSGILGIALLLIAAVLLAARTGKVKNLVAMAKGPEQYTSYVVMRQLRTWNETVCSGYEAKLDNYEEHGKLYHSREITVDASARALLKTYLDVVGKSTELNGVLTLTENADSFRIDGSLQYGEEDYPVTYETTEENFSVNMLCASGALDHKQLKKMLEEYETFVLEEIIKCFTKEGSQSTLSLLKEKTAHEAGGITAMERVITVHLTKEDNVVVMQTLFDRILADEQLREVYEAGSLTGKSYESSVEDLRTQLLSIAEATKIQIFVTDKGSISGVCIKHPEGMWELGFDCVANKTGIGIRAQVVQESKNIFEAEGTFLMSDGMFQGTLQGQVSVEEELQKFTLQLSDVSVMGVVHGRMLGEVQLLLTDGPLEDVGASVSLNASDEYQELLLSVIYGGADQLLIELTLRDAD